MLKKNPRKNMETLKVPGVAKEFNIDTQTLKIKTQGMEELQTSENKHGNSQETLRVSMFIAWVWGRGETGHNRPPKITLRVSMFIAWVWGRGETGHNRPPKITLRVSMFIAWVWGRGETGHNRPPKITLRVSMFIASAWGRGETGKMRVQKFRIGDPTSL